MSKKVYFDGLGLIDGHFSGIGQYILGILRGLDDIIEHEKMIGNPVPEVKVIIPYDELHKFRKFGFKHINPKVFPLPFRYMAALWHRGKLPPIDLWCGRGYYVFTRFVSMPLLFSKSSVIIYDLSYELHKEYSDDGNARFLSGGVKKSLEQVSHIFTISKNSKSEIESIYKVAPSKISVATPAADQKYFYRRSDSEIRRVKEKYGIKNNYILALSNLEPRKNLDALVDAYCALPEDYRKNTSLLLVGVSGWKTDKLFDKIIKRVNEGYDIIRPSEFVTDDDKPAVISGASMLVYPSHYEGFGMPPLEALACGVPVITANNSSLPEVVGSAAVMIAASDITGLTESIQNNLRNLDKVTAKALVDGPAQANSFSWTSSAEKYWDIIKKEIL